MGGKITAIDGAAEGLPLTVYVDGKPALTLSREMVEKLGLRVGGAFPPTGTEEGTDEGGEPSGRMGGRTGGGPGPGGASGPDEDAHAEMRAEHARDLEGVKSAALRLLSVRARSVEELGSRLARKGYDADVVSTALRDLESVGLLDDRAFARMWAEERVRLRPVGPMRLRRELSEKGVPPGIVNDTLERTYAEHTEVELAMRALRKRGSGRLVDAAERARLQAFLLRRGFGYEAIAQAIEKVGAGSEDAATDI